MKIALLANTSPLRGNSVTRIKLTLLAFNVVVKQTEYVPISHTANSQNINLEHITLEKLQAQIMLKHKFQAYNSECNVEVSYHEL